LPSGHWGNCRAFNQGLWQKQALHRTP
jgi:hypothetical protein